MAFESEAFPIPQFRMPAAHEPIMNYYRAMAPLRVAGYMNRMDQPVRGARMSPGAPPASLDPSGADLAMMRSPGFEQQANSLLGEYGMSLPQVGPNAILPNAGFFGNHPRLSSALEGAFLGMSNTRPSETTGEGITNAIAGGLGARNARNALLTQQMMAPFGAAEQLEKLSDLQGQRSLRDAQLNEYNARAYALRNPIPKAHAQHIDAQGNMWEYYDDGSMKNVTPAGVKFPIPGQSQNSVWSHVPSHLVPYIHAKGIDDPTKMSSQDWADVNTKFRRDQVNDAVKRSTEVFKATGKMQGQQTAQLKESAQNLQRLHQQYSDLEKIKPSKAVEQFGSMDAYKKKLADMDNAYQKALTDHNSLVDKLLPQQQQGPTPAMPLPIDENDIN